MSSEKNRPEVICVGQAVVDCITRNIRQIPGDAGRKTADSINLNVGGDAANEAMALADLGRRAALVCCVGEDHAGRMILAEAQRKGVDTENVTVRPGLATPVADIIVRADGSRTSVNSRAIDLEGYEPQLPGWIRENSGEGIRVVSFASLFRPPLDEPDVIRRLIREAHESGAVVCADTKLPIFREVGLEEIEDILPMIDYLFPNEEEALYYTDWDDAGEAALELLTRGVGHVVIKRGAEGICAGRGWENPAVGCGESFCTTCLASHCSIRENEKHRGGEIFTMPAVPVEAVDTTGAGDHFAAGFIDALLDQKGFRACCEAGLAAAARCIAHTGGTR